MGTINALRPTNAGAISAFTPSEVAGDVVPYQGGDLLVEFENGHSSAITVNFAPTKSSTRAEGAGNVPVPTRSLEIDASEHGAFLFKAGEINAYLNSSRQIPITYTGGNVAMLVRALAIVR